MIIIKDSSVSISLSGIPVIKALGYLSEEQELKSKNLHATIAGSLIKAINLLVSSIKLYPVSD